ncbi:MAG: cache domain-containing protein [Candidatus Aminicenantes bacterium]|nr:cache domain-containing protein [Candidatus Aminicenantes bacterium]MDH5383467.1 cache domain-containing protein [Candidatus Aminicenantes bacterium]
MTLILGTRLEHRTIFSLAQAKVRHDLASAWMVYNEKLNRIRDIVQLSSSLESIKTALQNNEKDVLIQYFTRLRNDFNLDVLNLTDAHGQVFIRTNQPEISGDDQSKDPFVSRALQGETITATQIIPKEELMKEKSLVEKAYLKIVPTQKAAPSAEDYEEDGMLLKAASPLIDEKGDVLGVLYGGILLNRNYEIVDRVKEIVFKGEKYKGREIGTATIFQNDLRISTNVKKENGERAIGTRVSREVNQAVLKEGKSWIHRAFVVNDWYIAAYEPIKNIDDQIIGILYVGMLEKPYIDLRNKVMATFTGMAIMSVILLLVILFFITSSIIQPLQQMVNATNKIANGDLSHKVNINFQDEIGQLGHSFNRMTENLKKANEKLILWGKTLEKRVEERTQKLREMQDSLVRSEKLASLGKMAAGVAHEINNPLTSILLNTHLMLEKVKKNSRFRENLSLIADETSRCSEIVKGLLEFSHQNPPEKNFADVNDLINLTLSILENQVAFQNIKIIKNLDQNLPQIQIDINKMKQVFWNLMINAAEAMPEGGMLTLISRLSENSKYIEIEFKDTGLGIPKENLNKLFDPFFTTKGGGTGLGLAVSYGIIEQHKGKIEVQSKKYQGSTFAISLPIS